MNPKQSEDFDSKVRKLAEEAESAYQAHSWTLMEQLLNDKKNKKKFAIWYWPLSGLGLIALLWLGYSYFNPAKQDKIENQLQIIPRTNAYTDQSYLYALQITAERIFDLHEIESPIIVKSVAEDLNKDPVAIQNNQKLKNATHISSELIANNKTRNLNKSNLNSAVSVKGNDKNNFSVLRPDPFPNPIITDPAKPELINQSIETEPPVSPVVSTERLLNIPGLASLDPSLEYTRKINLKDWPDEELSKKQVRHSSSALILNLAWSPEYTSVIKRSIGNLGNTYGFNIGYRFNNWTISAGLQKSSKDYNAKKEDYKIEEGSYYKNLTFVNINGNCNVLQLPVTLGYNIVSTKQVILQLNASVSSLRMDKEKYIYDYFHPNWKPGHDIYDYSYKNWHWLAAATAGLSIQKSIAKNWSVSISPYYQFPLKGIGEGKVRLQSFGSQVGLHWNIHMGK
jgi:hypothetical protein